MHSAHAITGAIVALEEAVAALTGQVADSAVEVDAGRRVRKLPIPKMPFKVQRLRFKVKHTLAINSIFVRLGS